MLRSMTMLAGRPIPVRSTTVGVLDGPHGPHPRYPLFGRGMAS